jgi:hypothetical protein
VKNSEHTATNARINAAKTPTLPALSGEEKENNAASERELAARVKMAILSVISGFIGILYHKHLQKILEVEWLTGLKLKYLPQPLLLAWSPSLVGRQN